MRSQKDNGDNPEDNNGVQRGRNEDKTERMSRYKVKELPASGKLCRRR